MRAALLIAVLSVSAAVTAQDKTQEESARARAEGRPVGTATYRLDFQVHELEQGKRVNSRTYTLLTDGKRQNCQIRVGTRVPITTASRVSGAPPNVQYHDVGLNVDCSAAAAPQGIAFEAVFEVSGVAEGAGARELPVVRQYRFRTATILTPKKPQLIAELDDPHSPRRLQIEVSASKLN